MGLGKADKKRLQSEVVSNEARLKLTRLMRRRSDRTNDSNANLINRNHFINTARTVLGLPIYRLEADDVGMYQDVDFGWHFAETELVMRRPDTAQLVETLGDMLQQGMLDLGEVNRILADDNSSIRFRADGFDEDISLHLLSTEEIKEENEEPDHPNIRLLTQRMETAFDEKDYAGVLHASASIFETLAKLVFTDPKVENQTLASLFDGYRKRSELPSPLLDYILETYRHRNSEPLAGHGATQPPKVTAKNAAVLIEITKMCVRLERRLADQEMDAKTVLAGTKGGLTPAPEAPPAPTTASSPKPLKKPKKKKPTA